MNPDELPAAPPNDDDLLFADCYRHNIEQLLRMEAEDMVRQIAETIDCKIMGRLVIAQDFPRPK